MSRNQTTGTKTIAWEAISTLEIVDFPSYIRVSKPFCNSSEIIKQSNRSWRMCSPNLHTLSRALVTTRMLVLYTSMAKMLLFTPLSSAVPTTGILSLQKTFWVQKGQKLFR